MQFNTADKKIIVVDKEAQNHLSAHPDVMDLLGEAISKLIIPDSVSRIEKEINFDRVVGISSLVSVPKVEANQKTYFAFRKARKFPSHVVLKKSGESCSTVTLSIYFNESSKKLTLLTAYIGYICPDEPFYFKDRTSLQYKGALGFWSEHALIYDKNIMDEAFESNWQNELRKTD